MLLKDLNQQLHWPVPDHVLNPPGAGPQVYARLTRQKVGAPLRLRPDGRDAQVGILTSNPASDETDPPLAIVCEFPIQVSNETIEEAHKLAWNFCHSPLLITIEPHQIRAWSCYEMPRQSSELLTERPLVGDFKFDSPRSLREHVSALDWLELVSGAFFLKNQGRFPIEKRADRLLLSNLAEVRRQLVNSNPKLPPDIAHDLLARLIFVQFLFHRKDAAGKAALNADVLERLHKENKLSAKYQKLTEILGNESDTYALFRWLNKIFNGDLFPGKGATEEEQLREWEEERRQVFADPHLKILADFVSGTLDMGTGQQCLWPMYSFDAIPLDFISSIYEEFVSTQDDHNGSHYTPGHVVDFMLDKVLPWKSTKWDLKVLDPACGSGIFLVKVFQRLIHRWRRANRGEPNATDLRSLLSRNLFGVDINPHAVRVASFSLYLAMCDEIDPRHYWTKVKFPRLREKNIIAKDFFAEDTQGFRTEEDVGKYDLVIGNAPWGQGTLKPESEEWAESHGWQSFNDQVGTLFLPKGASLLKRSGRLMMLQPAGDLLFNSNTTALRFREKLFSTYKVEEVVNFSAIRFGLFPNAIGPTCSITLRPVPPEQA